MRMRMRGSARLTAVLAVASMVGGCGAVGGAGGDGVTPPPSLELRIATSSAAGPCTAPPLTSDGPGSACDMTGTTTYDVGASLGVLTPMSATRDLQGAEQTLLLQFGTADTTALGDTTAEALGQQLAVLLDGRVISAPSVQAPITEGKVVLGFGTSADADQVAEALGASPTP